MRLRRSHKSECALRRPCSVLSFNRRHTSVGARSTKRAQQCLVAQLSPFTPESPTSSSGHRLIAACDSCKRRVTLDVMKLEQKLGPYYEIEACA
jgi:hypothetical protein